MRFHVYILSCILFCSCGSIHSRPASFFPKPDFSSVSVPSKTHVESVSAKNPVSPISSISDDSTFRKVSSFGSADNLIDSDKAVDVSVSFDHAQIEDVLNIVLVDLFGKSYAMKPDDKTLFSLHVSGKYTFSEFIPVLSSALHTIGLSVVVSSGNLCQIVPFKDASSSGGVSSGTGSVSRFVRLKYLSASSAVSAIKPFLSDSASVSSDKVSNSVLVSDSKVNIDKILSVLSLMDVSFYSDVSWRIYPLRHAPASVVASDISKLFLTGGIYSREGVVEGSFQVLSLDSINSVLVLTRWPALLRLISSWLGSMDTISISGSYYVYFVRHSTASYLASIISQLVSKQSQTSSVQSPSNALSSSLVNSGGAVNSTGSSSVSGVGASVLPVSNDNSFSSVTVVPDASTNSLLFRCTSGSWDDLLKLLKKIDVVRKQVFVNVLIMEVTLSGGQKSGVEFLFNSAISGSTLQTANDSTSGLNRSMDAPLGTLNGFTFGIYDNQKMLNSLVYALKNDSSINLLSSPDVLVLDGSKATIEIGDDVPTQTGSTTSAVSGSTVTTSVQFRKVGVLLNVVPSIGDGGSVTLDLNQEVSEIGDFVASLNNYKFLTRKIQTSLVVPDSHTVVIGGLMRNNETKVFSGVPLLSSIPYLGRLFLFHEVTHSKTELIVCITPHICSDSSSFAVNSQNTYDGFAEIKNK